MSEKSCCDNISRAAYRFADRFRGRKVDDAFNLGSCWAKSGNGFFIAKVQFVKRGFVADNPGKLI
jgi:hypothetical protein